MIKLRIPVRLFAFHPINRCFSSQNQGVTSYGRGGHEAGFVFATGEDFEFRLGSEYHRIAVHTKTINAIAAQDG